MLGALLAAWHVQDDLEDADFVAHRSDARALGDATQALGQATGTVALDRWNDAEGRKVNEVLRAVDSAIAVLYGQY